MTSDNLILSNMAAVVDDLLELSKEAVEQAEARLPEVHLEKVAADRGSVQRAVNLMVSKGFVKSANAPDVEQALLEGDVNDYCKALIKLASTAVHPSAVSTQIFGELEDSPSTLSKKASNDSDPWKRALDNWRLRKRGNHKP